MQTDNSSTDRQKEKQTLINSLWESLFGGDIKKPPSKKMNINPNRRLYMVGLEDFSLNSSDNRFGNLTNKGKINDDKTNRKQTIRNTKMLPDSDKRYFGQSERPSTSNDAERKRKLRNEKINRKGDEKKLKHPLPDGLISVTDKDKETLKKEKMKNCARDVKNLDRPTDDLLKRELQQHSKVSFNLNHLPEDAKERSEIIAHVIERVDSLKKKMQDEKQKLDNKSKEQQKRSRSSSVGKTGESSSVKTIYWPKNENNTSEDCVLSNFSAVTEVLNNYSDPKRQRLEKWSKTQNEKPGNIGDVDKNPENIDSKDEGNAGKLEFNSLNHLLSKNIEECKIVANNDEVCPNNKLQNAKHRTEIDLKQKSIYKIKSYSASDTSICSSRVKNNRFEESGLATNKLMRNVDEIKCDVGNVKKIDKIDEDAKEQIMTKENQILSKDVDVNKLDFGVFNVEIKNDELSTLFIMESNLGCDMVNLRQKEKSNHFLARDGSGERGIMKSSCETEKLISDHHYKVNHITTEFEQNNSINATNDSENTKSKLIQSFMESQNSVLNTLPPSRHIDTVNKNYEINISPGHDYNSLTGESSLVLQTCNDFYKEGNEVNEHLVPMMPENESMMPENESTIPDNESTIPDNSVGDIFKLKNYIPASQRKTEMKVRYVPRLVSLSFYMQVASCYKIVAQFDKLMNYETFSNQDNNIIKKRVVQFVKYPEFENSHLLQSDSCLSENSGTEELTSEINDDDDDDLQTEYELESISDHFEQNQGDIKSKVENCPVEAQFCNSENNEIKTPITPISSISNPVYVVIMDANEKNSSSFGKAEICKIESSRFSEMILNEISGVNKKLVVEGEPPKLSKNVGSEPLKFSRNDKNSDVERKKKSNSIDKSKKGLIPSQSRDTIKSRASSVCLPSEVNKYHTKRNTNLPRVRFSQSNVVINRPKINSQVNAASKQCSNVKNDLQSNSRMIKDKRTIEPPEYLNSQLMSIRDEIRELKMLFAKR